MATKTTTSSSKARDLSAELAYLTRALKAPSLAAAIDRLAERARAESWTHEEFLLACLQREVAAREAHGGEGRIRAARFPARKALEEFDFDHQRSLKRDTIAHLGTLDFVTAKENVVFLGPPGTGKTPLSPVAVGYRACVAVQETWFSRDLPLLQVIVREADRTGGPVDVRGLEVEDLERADIRVAIRALAHEDPPFFTKIEGSMADHYETVMGVTGHARRAAGTWPSVETVPERLVEQLASAADEVEDEQARSRLKKTAKWLGSTGRGILVAAVGQALGGVATGQT